MRWVTFCASMMTLWAWAGSVRGQTTPAPVLYQLGPNSTYVQGCFPPCECPVSLPDPVTGTFVLTQTNVDPLFTHYDVTAVHWTVVRDGKTIRISGSGTYRVGGEVAVLQELSLDLRTDGGAPVHFDSGLVAVSTRWPQIDVTISIHGMQCADTVIHVVADPAAAPVTLYGLAGKSSYQEGCFGPCECALRPPVAITGTFLLSPGASPTFERVFNITDVLWKTQGAAGDIQLTGSGTYTLGGEFAATQQLILDLSANGAAPVHYDSGVVVGGGEFPAIDIQIQTPPTLCHGAIITVQARPLGAFDVMTHDTTADLSHLQACAAGPDVLQPVTTCQDADLDGDGDVDMDDFGIFERCWGAPGGIADSACAGS